MEKGGRADKFGNEFEKLWVVDQALCRVMRGEATALRWEPVGPEGEGVDLQIFSETGQEAHQCKIGNRSEGRWTIAELAQRNVLQSIQEQLELRGADRFVFVSRDRSALEDLAERARRCDRDPRAFREHSLSSQELRRSFRTLCRHWRLDPTDDHDVSRALSLLGRCRYEGGIASEDDKRRLHLLAELLIEGDGRKVVDALARFLVDRLGNSVHADELRSFLAAEGYPPRNLAGDHRVPEAIEHHQQHFKAFLEPDLIAGRVLPRRETRELLDLLSEDRGPRILILHGDAGAGKTGVLLELTRELERRGVPYLPLRLDGQRPPRGSLESFSRDVLELPAPPQICLHHLAGERPSVLVVDQLDAIRWTGAHSSESWALCRRMLEAALELPDMTVVLACRTFDLDDHPQIRRWEETRRAQAPTQVKRIQVAGLPEDAVRDVVGGFGGDYASMSTGQRSLLANAHGLQLWCRLVERGALPSEFATKTDLIQAFWDDCFARAESDAGIPRERLSVVLGKLVEYLDDQRTLIAPELVLRDAPDVRQFLSSQSVIHAPGKGLRFSHQSHLDYLIAARVAEEALVDDRRTVEWVRGGDQSLFRREQLRQLLMLLRDQQPRRYLAALRGLLREEGIRYHLRHLALGLLRAVPDPSAEEVSLVVELLEDEQWRPRVLSQGLAGSPSWFEALAERGVWERWLASNEEAKIDAARWQCRVHVEARGDIVRALLLPYWTNGQEVWRQRIAETLAYDPAADTSELFEWRLELVRSGDALRPGLWYQLPKLAVKYPRRAIELLGLLVLREDARLASGELIADSDIAIDRPKAMEIAEAGAMEPVRAWEVLLPLVPDLWADFRKKKPYFEFEFEPYLAELALDHHPTAFALWLTCSTLLRAIEAVAGRSAGSDFLALIEALGSGGELLPPLRWLTLKTLAAGPDEAADSAIEWLLADQANFETRLFERDDELVPAAAVLRRFAKACSSATYLRLEGFLLCYFPKKEWENRRCIAEANRKAIERGEAQYLWASSTGRAQQQLLKELPRERMSRAVIKALAVWTRKFGDADRKRPRIRIGSVCSPIPSERLHLVSDSVWRHIIGTDWASEKRVERWRDDDSVERASHENFSRDFQRATHMMPKRFVSLILELAKNPSAALPSYIEALLLALEETTEPGKMPEELRPWQAATPDDLNAVFTCFTDLNQREIALRFCRVIAKRLDLEPRSEILGLIAELSTNHPDPGPSYEFTPLNEDQINVDLYVAPSNTVRGAATEAIEALLFHNGELLPRFLPTIRKLIEDPHPLVRVAARKACLPTLKLNRDLAVDLYVRACDHHDDQVLLPDHFLQYAWRSHPEPLEPLLKRMLSSRFPALVEHAAFWVVAGWVVKGFFSGLAEDCLEGNDAMLQGAARALCSVFKRGDGRREECWRLMCKYLLRGENADGRYATELMRDRDILNSDWGPQIAQDILAGHGFEDACFRVLSGLKDLEGPLAPYAEALLVLVQRLAACEPEEIREHYWRFTELPSVLLRLYDEAETKESHDLRELCLDAWDRLLESGVEGTLRQLELIDSRS